MAKKQPAVRNYMVNNLLLNPLSSFPSQNSPFVSTDRVIEGSLKLYPVVKTEQDVTVCFDLLGLLCCSKIKTAGLSNLV